VQGLGAVPAVFLTAASEPGMKNRLLQLGATSVLGKPFRPSELVRTVQVALETAAQ